MFSKPGRAAHSNNPSTNEEDCWPEWQKCILLWKEMLQPETAWKQICMRNELIPQCAHYLFFRSNWREQGYESNPSQSYLKPSEESNRVNKWHSVSRSVSYSQSVVCNQNLPIIPLALMALEGRPCCLGTAIQTSIYIWVLLDSRFCSPHRRPTSSAC